MLTEVQGVLVFTGDAQHRQHNAFFFHLVIADADLVHEINSCLFCHVDVVGVVHDVHAVCLMVKYHAGIRCDFHNTDSFFRMCFRKLPFCFRGHRKTFFLV